MQLRNKFCSCKSRATKISQANGWRNGKSRATKGELWPVPKASRMGGVWERQIPTVRNVLNPLLLKNGDQLNDESLRPFMCEVEAIVSSRPLTVHNLNSPQSLEPFTPNHFSEWTARLLFHLLVCSRLQVNIYENGGDAFIIWATSFGLAGERNLYFHCKNDKGGDDQEEIFKPTTSFWSRMMMHQEIVGH